MLLIDLTKKPTFTKYSREKGVIWLLHLFILGRENQTTSQIDCASGELPEDKTLSNSEISTERYFVIVF